MKLNQYPTAIAQVEEALLKASIDVEVQTELLSFMDGEIEAMIASDSALKNEQHRKARRLDLQQQPDYLQGKIALKEAKEDRERLQIKLNWLRNQFSVAKLEARLQIAQLSAVA